MIDRFQRFSFDISEIYRYWHQIAADEMSKYGLKGPYAVYFTTLYFYEEGLSAAMLSEKTGRDKADVSRAVSIMEKEGFLIRVRNSTSQYRAPLILTEKGRRTAEMINERARQSVEFGGAGLTDEERETFYYGLDMIASNLQKLTSKDK